VGSISGTPSPPRVRVSVRCGACCWERLIASGMVVAWLLAERAPWPGGCPRGGLAGGVQRACGRGCPRAALAATQRGGQVGWSIGVVVGSGLANLTCVLDPACIVSVAGRAGELLARRHAAAFGHWSRAGQRTVGHVPRSFGRARRAVGAGGGAGEFVGDPYRRGAPTFRESPGRRPRGGGTGFCRRCRRVFC